MTLPALQLAGLAPTTAARQSSAPHLHSPSASASLSASLSASVPLTQTQTQLQTQALQQLDSDYTAILPQSALTLSLLPSAALPVSVLPESKDRDTHAHTQNASVSVSVSPSLSPGEIRRSKSAEAQHRDREDRERAERAQALTQPQAEGQRDGSEGVQMCLFCLHHNCLRSWLLLSCALIHQWFVLHNECWFVAAHLLVFVFFRLLISSLLLDPAP